MGFETAKKNTFFLKMTIFPADGPFEVYTVGKLKTLSKKKKILLYVILAFNIFWRIWKVHFEFVFVLAKKTLSTSWEDYIPKY